ncbi:uncharacterized protein F5891DRAFT_207654 [Suillus fuscotomentosus]|uniref:Secreted protein n=1 Tax=Suillus fuscotomentosus TaxID=1912939 RepID=A0AAD4EK15_9AGAM|nr:uncharacterized protein F5891DRAFT_207654 [Suillus fuscotomentosus]KAG1907645.1 hypothetical protein F5891DRAFT_207654 [Suillus fuscotomentosus]
MQRIKGCAYSQFLSIVMISLFFHGTHAISARYARDCPARLLRIGPDYRVHEEPCTIVRHSFSSSLIPSEDSYFVQDYFRSTCKRSAFHVNRVHDCRYCIKESVLALFSAAVAKCDVQRDTVSAISRCAFILVFAIRKRAKSAHRQ